jgi:predicted PurR-regulated permease PerM
VNASITGRSSVIALWILTGLAVAMFLRTARELLIPIVIAILVSSALEPLVARLARLRIPRVFGSSLVVATVVGITAWGLYASRDQVMEALTAIPETIQRVGQWVGGRQAARQAEEVTRSPEIIQQGASWILSVVSDLTIVTFLVYFLLLSGSHFKKRFIELAGPHLRQRRITEEVLNDINEQIQRFLQVTAITSVVVGAATWGALALMGIQQAAVWGVLAGVFNSIPYFGPVIVSGGLFAVGFLQFGEPAVALKVLAVSLAITSLEGWVLTPLLLGRAEQMHVLVVFVGVLVWTWLWGAWGTVLAVPMLAVIKSICDHVEPLKPVSRLLAP